jgi:muramoyltetrapeptide carboxypeptidase
MIARRPLRPHGLKPNDRVRLVAPASPFDRHAFQVGLGFLEGFGLRPVWDRAELLRTGFLAGDDQARARRLMRACLEPGTRAVWIIRGGYGTARLLPWLDLEAIAWARKPIIGFSDLTALLSPLCGPGGLVALHGPVITQLERISPLGREWLKALLFGERAPGPVPLGRPRVLARGQAEGRLRGGNLTVLASLCGTPYQPDFRGAIACLEDVAEPAYRLDRSFSQLCEAGCFRGVRGVVLGELVGCSPAGRSAWSARAVLERAVLSLGVPALSGAPFGHGRRHVALPLGARAVLDATRGRLELAERVVEKA